MRHTLIALFMLLAALLPRALFAQDVRPSHSDPGWQAAYWTNATLAGAPTIQRFDPQLAFDWGFSSPDPAIYYDNFSARWERYIDVTPGTYVFTATADDGIRLWVDDELLINQWSDHPVQRFTAEKQLGPGHHLVRVEYYERAGAAVANVAWTLQSEPNVNSWRGEYFDNTVLSGAPVLVRADPEINFRWGNGGPGSGVGADNFSARWTRSWELPAGNYRFTVTVDDGARLFVNGHTLIDAWRDQAERPYSGDIYLPGGATTIQLEYYERSGAATAQLRWQRLTGDQPSEPPITEWKGEYFNNRTLSGNPVLVRNDRTIDFDWGNGAPANGLPADDFSARWQRTLTLAAGNYRFTATVDDGMRVKVNDRLLLESWREQSLRTETADLYLDGRPVTVVVEYFEARGRAVAQLSWARTDHPTPNPTWAHYRNDNYGVEFDYPAGWQQFQGEVTHYEGPDGFFVIDAAGNASLDQFVQNEINHPLRPYGNNPRVESLTVDNQDARLILPGTNQPSGMRNQAALVALYPQAPTIGGYRYNLFVLYASEPQIRRIAQTVNFLASAPPPTGRTIVVDNHDPGFAYGGDPAGWHWAAEGQGGDLLWSRNNDRAHPNYNWVRWYPDLPAGRYELFVYIPDRYTTTSNARYWIAHSGGLTQRAVDQSANGDRWVSLGVYDFRGTRDDYLSLADVTYEPRFSRLIAWDAAKWEPR